MHTVIETPGFIADAKKSGLTEDERSAIVNTLAQNPTAGHEIKGTGGARKVRFPARGRGKSGGYRVITFYSGQDVRVLLNVFSKGDRVDLSQAERNEMRKELAGVAEEYRRGVRRYVERR